jgi:hypothetical protein
LTYGGERRDAQALDQLETILRAVADELTGWRTRALKAEAELKELSPRGTSGGGGRESGRVDPEIRTRVAELEAENKMLRQRVEAAKARVQDLLARLTFLEEQASEGASK